MKNIAIYLLIAFISTTAIAQEKKDLNPCDSLTYVIKVPGIPIKDLHKQTLALLKTHKLLLKESFNFESMNDSTIMCRGLYRVIKGRYTSEMFGSYRIYSDRDGDIGYNIRISLRDNMLRLQMFNINHANSRYSFGDVCGDTGYKFPPTGIRAIQIECFHILERIREHLRNGYTVDPNW